MGRISSQIISLLIYIGIGIALRKTGKMSKESSAMLSTLVIGLMMPCAIIKSFLKMEVNILVTEIWVTIVFASIMFALLSILGKVTKIFARIKNEEAGMWEFMIMFSNNIFMGFPMIEVCLGKEALIYASLVCIPCNTLIFSYGLYLASKGNGKYCFQGKEILNSCTMASAIAVFLVINPIKIPEIVLGIIDTMGNMASPLALIILGLALADSLDLSLFQDWKVYFFCGVKLLAAPAIVGSIMGILGEKYENIIGVLVITAAMPASNTAILMAEKYDNRMDFVAKCVTMSTLLFVFTTPFLLYLNKSL